MQIELNLQSVKKYGRALLVLTNLFTFAAATHYVYHQYTSKDFFEVLEFDVNNRLPDIRARYKAILKEQEAKEQAQKAATPEATSATLK